MGALFVVWFNLFKQATIASILLKQIFFPPGKIELKAMETSPGIV